MRRFNKKIAIILSVAMLASGGAAFAVNRGFERDSSETRVEEENVEKDFEKVKASKGSIEITDDETEKKNSKVAEDASEGDASEQDVTEKSVTDKTGKMKKGNAKGRSKSSINEATEATDEKSGSSVKSSAKSNKSKKKKSSKKSSEVSTSESFVFETEYDHVGTYAKGSGWRTDYNDEALMLPSDNSHKTGGTNLHTISMSPCFYECQRLLWMTYTSRQHRSFHLGPDLPCQALISTCIYCLRRRTKRAQGYHSGKHMTLHGRLPNRARGFAKN